jgi:HK97 family phage major capsid protein
MSVATLKEKIEAAGKNLAAALEAGNVEDVRKINGDISELREMVAAEVSSRELRTLAERIPAPISGTPELRGWDNVRQQILTMVKENRKDGRLQFGEAEIRAIASGGAGVNTESGVVTALVDGGKLRPKVSVFTGANSQTVVPVMNPTIALPAGQAEGGTSIGADSTGVFAGNSLTLKPWYSILAVSQGALQSTDLGGYLPGIFSEAFGAAIDKAIVAGAGSGNDALGVFTANSGGVHTTSDVAIAAAGAPKWVDLVGLASTIIGLGGDLSKAAIVLNPVFVGSLIAENTASMEAVKTELLTRGTIRGIPVIETGYAPTTLTAGSYTVVGGHFRHYALAVARELVIDQIKVVGSDNITFQAWMYMQGKPLIGGSFRRLKTV